MVTAIVAAEEAGEGFGDEEEEEEPKQMRLVSDFLMLRSLAWLLSSTIAWAAAAETGPRSRLIVTPCCSATNSPCCW